MKIELKVHLQVRFKAPLIIQPTQWSILTINVSLWIFAYTARTFGTGSKENANCDVDRAWVVLLEHITNC